MFNLITVEHLAERTVDFDRYTPRMPLKTGGRRVVLDDVTSRGRLEAALN